MEQRSLRDQTWGTWHFMVGVLIFKPWACLAYLLSFFTWSWVTNMDDNPNDPKYLCSSTTTVTNHSYHSLSSVNVSVITFVSVVCLFLSCVKTARTWNFAVFRLFRSLLDVLCLEVAWLCVDQILVWQRCVHVSVWSDCCLNKSTPPSLWCLAEGCSPPSWVQAAVKPGLAALRINCTVTASQIKKVKKEKKI